ncbi:transcriptional regulator (FNR/CRP family) protein [Bacillus sp. B14905]|nr:transcriptional regulator (FNR/CRP family) protein [Bacillus sp. B14905]
MDNMFEKIMDLFQKHGVFIKVNKGNKIFLEGERSKEIYYIKSGVISISQETEAGKELTIRICGPDSIIGEGSLFCNLVYNSMTAKVLESATLYVLSRKSLEHLLEEQPTIMVEYMKWLQTENLKHQSRLRDLVLNGKKGALFSTLIRLSNTYGKPLEDGSIFIEFQLTNTEIANLCATSREMINRMLNDLKKHDILTLTKALLLFMIYNF